MRRDGCYSWLVLAASILIITVVESVVILPSLFLLEYAEDFPVSKAKLGFIASLHSAMCSLLSVLAGVLIEWLGYRVTGSLGAVLMALGLLLSSVAQSVSMLYLTYGVIAAMGNALSQSCAIVIVHHYFQRYQGLASGMVMCGYSVAQFVFIPLLRWLIDKYGWRVAHAVHAGIVLNVLVCASLFRPVDQLTNDEDDNIKGGPEDIRDTGSGADKAATSFQQNEHCHQHEQHHHHHHHHHHQQQQQQQQKQQQQLELEQFDIVDDPKPDTPVIPSSRHRWYETLNSQIDLSLLKHVGFMLFTVSYMFACVVNEVVYKLVVSKAVSVGIDKFRASMLNTYMGMASLMSRLIFSVVVNMKCTDAIIMNGVFVFLTGVLVASINLTTNYAHLVGFCVGLGACMSGMFGIKYYVLAILIGRERMALAYGLHLSILSVSNLSALPLAGWSYDITGSYDLSFYVTGLMGVIGSVLIFVTACYHRRNNKK